MISDLEIIITIAFPSLRLAIPNSCFPIGFRVFVVRKTHEQTWICYIWHPPSDEFYCLSLYIFFGLIIIFINLTHFPSPHHSYTCLPQPAPRPSSICLQKTLFHFGVFPGLRRKPDDRRRNENLQVIHKDSKRSWGAQYTPIVHYHCHSR